MNAIYARFFVSLVLAGAVCVALAGPVRDRVQAVFGYIVGRDTEEVIANLPAASPRTARAGRCQESDVLVESEQARSEGGWTLKGYDRQLELWAIYHFGDRAGTSRGTRCADGNFIVRAWQDALGERATGRLTTGQAARLVEVVDRYERSFARAKSLSRPGTQVVIDRSAQSSGVVGTPEMGAVGTATAGSPAAGSNVPMREPSFIEYLPPGRNVNDSSYCRRSQYECGLIEHRYRSSLEAAMRAGQIPPVSFVNWQKLVPSHWANVLREYPQFVAWLNANNARNCIDYARLVTWANAIGENAPLEDPRSVRDTRRILSEAKAKYDAAMAPILAARAEERARVAAEGARAAEAAAQERERIAREAEAKLQSFLNKNGDPQAIYLQAGRYEQASDGASAQRLYTFLVDTFPKTQWALNANNRLLAMRDNQEPAGRAQRERNDAVFRESTRGNYEMQDALDENRRRYEEASRREEQRRRAEEEQRRRAEEEMQRANEQRRRMVEEDAAAARRRW